MPLLYMEHFSLDNMDLYKFQKFLPALLKLAPCFYHKFYTTPRMLFYLRFHPNKWFDLKP